MRWLKGKPHFDSSSDEPRSVHLRSVKVFICPNAGDGLPIKGWCFNHPLLTVDLKRGHSPLRLKMRIFPLPLWWGVFMVYLRLPLCGEREWKGLNLNERGSRQDVCIGVPK